MKAMIYEIRFEDNKDIGDIEFALNVIKSPIRLEIGDKIALSGESFDVLGMDKDIIEDYLNEMMEILLKKAIKASKFYAYFEISDIIYYHECYDNTDFGFNGVITLKGK